MAKNRDFLDYLSLGNQLVQTARLGGVERAQAALVALHAEQVRTDQRQEDARAQEDQVREFVFGCSKWLHGLEAKFGKSKPVGTLALYMGCNKKSKVRGKAQPAFARTKTRKTFTRSWKM